MSTYLSKLSWKEAEQKLNPEAIVLIPLGAACKEHGPHLPLNNDQIIAEYLAQKVAELSQVVVAPTITFSFYPAFVEYPGSISLKIDTAASLLTDVCESLARFGPRRFYVLNTGFSTLKPLTTAAQKLLEKNVTMTFTNFDKAMQPTASEVASQEGGSHADEVETSMMLYIAPELVNMNLACKDFEKDAAGRLSRSQGADTSFSPSGVWGDATLATESKGKKVVECLVGNILKDIDALRIM